MKNILAGRQHDWDLHLPRCCIVETMVIPGSPGKRQRLTDDSSDQTSLTDLLNTCIKETRELDRLPESAVLGLHDNTGSIPRRTHSRKVTIKARTKKRLKQEGTRRPVMITAAACLLYARNRTMSALQVIQGLGLFKCHASKPIHLVQVPKASETTSSTSRKRAKLMQDVREKPVTELQLHPRDQLQQMLQELKLDQIIIPKGHLLAAKVGIGMNWDQLRKLKKVAEGVWRENGEREVIKGVSSLQQLNMEDTRRLEVEEYVFHHNTAVDDMVVVKGVTEDGDPPPWFGCVINTEPLMLSLIVKGRP
ncbi:hypothetical protein Bbelb_049590 [Branchiostoma belcheri]|nr:hypothetical protein Bbelb_049590 [Branchiostoma belcheri]